MLDIDLIMSEQLSIIQDPFKKDCITSIRVTYRKHLFEDKFVSEGNVQFNHGSTSANQSFNGENFDSVVLQIKAFIKTLN